MVAAKLLLPWSEAVSSLSVRQCAIAAAAKCSNRIARHLPEKPVFVRLTCVDDLYGPSCH